MDRGVIRWAQAKRFERLGCFYLAEFFYGWSDWTPPCEPPPPQHTNCRCVIVPNNGLFKS